MTQNQAAVRRDGFPPDQTLRRLVPPLSLKQAVPSDWHRDPPAFAGDPFMDWESAPEPPQESTWGQMAPRH